MLWISVSTVLTKSIRCLIALVGVVFANYPASAAFAETDDAKPLTIFAAASLSDVMPALLDEWQRATGQPVPRISFAASAVLARQVVAGAPADVFVSANKRWIDYVAQALSIDEVAPIARNNLVFAAPCRTASKYSGSIDAMQTHLLSGRFAMADPGIAPVGEYTRDFLEGRALWRQAKRNAAYAGNARLALLLIERGGLPGFVYASDAAASALVCTAINLSSHGAEPATYFGLALSGLPDKGLLSWLRSEAAQEIWQSHGFETPVSN